MGKPNKQKFYNSGHTSNANLNQLVTHKQKQIHKANNLNKKAKPINDPDISDIFLNQLSEDFSENVRSRHQVNLQAQLIDGINKLMIKSKVNAKNAFQVPIVDISSLGQLLGNDFDRKVDISDGQWGTVNQEDMAWKRLSCVLENDYKIYGWRVDAIANNINQIGLSLNRKGQTFQKVQQSTEKNNKTQQQNTANRNELLESEIHRNISKNLDKNKGSLDVNLKTMMLRKDPTFERTRRKFDQAGIDSVLMNTLPLNQELELEICKKVHKNKINPTENADKQKNENNQQQNLQDNQEINQQGKQIANQIQYIRDETQKQINKASQQLQGIKKHKMKIRKNFQKLYRSLRKAFRTLPYGQQLQLNENYWKIYKKIMKGEIGEQIGNYWQQQFHNQMEKDSSQIKYDKDEEQEKIQKNNIFIEKQADEISQQDPQNSDKKQIILNQEKNSMLQNRQMEEQQPVIASENIDIEEIQSKKQIEVQHPQIKIGQQINQQLVHKSSQQEENNSSSSSEEKMANLPQIIPIPNSLSLAVQMPKKPRQKRIKQVINIKPKSKPIKRITKPKQSYSTRKKGIKPAMKQLIDEQRKAKNNNNKNKTKEKDIFNPDNISSQSSVLKKERTNLNLINQNTIYDKNGNVPDFSMLFPFNKNYVSKYCVVDPFKINFGITLVPQITPEQLKQQQQKKQKQKKLREMMIQRQNNLEHPRQEIQMRQPQIIQNYQDQSDGSIQFSSQLSDHQIDPVMHNLNQNTSYRTPSILKIKEKLIKIIDHSRKLDFKSIYKKYLKAVKKKERNNNHAQLVTQSICFIAILHLSNERGYKLKKIQRNNFMIEFV